MVIEGFILPQTRHTIHDFAVLFEYKITHYFPNADKNKLIIKRLHIHTRQGENGVLSKDNTKAEYGNMDINGLSISLSHKEYG